MEYILQLKNINKSYLNSQFQLKNVSFSIPYGSIVGFIGENGAGKTTTMGTIIGTLKQDSGSVKLFGEDIKSHNRALKEHIGVVFDQMNFSEKLDVRQLNQVFKRMYKMWDEELFFDYMDRFSLPLEEMIGGFSRGMSMKLSLAVALSHDAKLLLLDEATAGLDPIARDEIIAVLSKVVQDEKRSILLSSHITSDIESIADELIFIKNGKIILQASAGYVRESYAVVTCNEEEINGLNKDIILCTRKKDRLIEVLVTDKGKVPSSIPIISNTLNAITIMIMKGDFYEWTHSK